MPIYEFYCPDCHMIYNFFSSTANTDKHPLCPVCNGNSMKKQMSLFSTSAGNDVDGDDSTPDIDEARIQKAMGHLEREAENIDENDPRQAAALMRRLTDMTGLNPGPGIEEFLSRMEAGEDPELLEAEMADILEEEKPFELKSKITGRRNAPPGVDDKLYDL